jgi:hypothetical protein
LAALPKQEEKRDGLSDPRDRVASAAAAFANKSASGVTIKKGRSRAPFSFNRR